MVGPYGGIDLRSAHPLLIVVGAKRTQSSPLTTSEASTLGQMRALMTK